MENPFEEKNASGSFLGLGKQAERCACLAILWPEGRSSSNGLAAALIFQSRLRQRARLDVVLPGVLLNHRSELLHPFFEFDTLFRRDHVTQVRPAISPMVFGVIQGVVKLLAVDLLPFGETALLPGLF